MDEELVTTICKEYRTTNADVTVRYAHATVDELIDVIEGNRCVPLRVLSGLQGACQCGLQRLASPGLQFLFVLQAGPFWCAFSGGMGGAIGGRVL